MFVVFLASNWEGGMRGRSQKLRIHRYMFHLAYIATRCPQGTRLSPGDSCRLSARLLAEVDPTNTVLDLQANVAAWHQTGGVPSLGNLNAEYQIVAHLSLVILRGRYMHICDWYHTFVHLVRDLRSSDTYKSQELPCRYKA